MHKKHPHIIILIFFLIQGIAHNLGHPVTPAFVTGLQIPDFMFGVFFATMSLGLMLGGPFWGVLGDIKNKRILIFIGLMLYTIGQIGFGFVHQQAIMIVFRLISGFGAAGAQTLLTSELIEVSKPERRATHLAWSAALFTLGVSIGYFLGGFIATNSTMVSLLNTSDLSYVFLVQGILNTIYAIFILIFFRDHEKTDTQSTNRISMVNSLKNIKTLPTVLVLFLLSLTLITIAKTNLEKYMDVYFNDLGYTSQDLGLFVMITGFVSLLASILIVPLIAKIKQQVLVIIVIQVLSSIVIFYVFRAQDFITTIYTVYMLYIIFKATYQPLEQNYIASHTTEGKYSTTMGIRQAFVSLGMIIGPLIGGFIYQAKPLWLFDSSAVAILLGVILLFIVFFKSRTDLELNVKK